MVKINLTKKEVKWLIEGFNIDSEFFKLNKIAKSIFNKLKKESET